MSDICKSLNFIIAYFANNNSLSNTEITFLSNNIKICGNQKMSVEQSLYKPTKSREKI